MCSTVSGRTFFHGVETVETTNHLVGCYLGYFDKTIDHVTSQKSTNRGSLLIILWFS